MIDLDLLAQLDDPYWRDMLELGGRVADCYETHTDLPSYLSFWFQVADLERMFR